MSVVDWLTFFVSMLVEAASQINQIINTLTLTHLQTVQVVLENQALSTQWTDAHQLLQECCDSISLKRSVLRKNRKTMSLYLRSLKAGAYWHVPNLLVHAVGMALMTYESLDCRHDLYLYTKIVHLKSYYRIVFLQRAIISNNLQQVPATHVAVLPMLPLWSRTRSPRTSRQQKWEMTTDFYARVLMCEGPVFSRYCG